MGLGIDNCYLMGIISLFLWFVWYGMLMCRGIWKWWSVIKGECNFSELVMVDNSLKSFEVI